MGPFAEGDSYGPVLEPLHVKIVGAQVRINPLIQPVLEDEPADRPHLEWNMLFPTSGVHRSGDPQTMSWDKGRNAPATFPRVTNLRLVSETLPWIIHIRAANNDIGVTCGEIIDTIGQDMAKLTTAADFERMSLAAKNELRAAYKFNRSTDPSVPGGRLGQGMKRLDFLRKNVMFGGILEGRDAERVIRSVCGDVLPCMFVFKCESNWGQKKQDIKEREARMKGASSARSTRSARSANSSAGKITVESPTTSDEEEESDAER